MSLDGVELIGYVTLFPFVAANHYFVTYVVWVKHVGRNVQVSAFVIGEHELIVSVGTYRTHGAEYLIVFAFVDFGKRGSFHTS